MYSLSILVLCEIECKSKVQTLELLILLLQLIWLYYYNNNIITFRANFSLWYYSNYPWVNVGLELSIVVIFNKILNKRFETNVNLLLNNIILMQY